MLFFRSLKARLTDTTAAKEDKFQQRHPLCSCTACNTQPAASVSMRLLFKWTICFFGPLHKFVRENRF